MEVWVAESCAVSRDIPAEDPTFLPLRATSTRIINADVLDESSLHEQESMQHEQADLASARKLREYYSKWEQYSPTDPSTPPPSSSLEKNETKSLLVKDKSTIISAENAEKAVEEKQKGNDCFKHSKWEDAVSHYTTAMALDYNNEIYPLNRAMARIKLKQWDLVLQDCDRALSLNASCVKAYFRKATAYFQTHKQAEALENITKALTLEPKNSPAKTLHKKIIAAQESGDTPIIEVKGTETAKNTNLLTPVHTRSQSPPIIKKENNKKIDEVLTQKKEEVKKEETKQEIIAPNAPVASESPKETKKKEEKTFKVVPMVPSKVPRTLFEFERNFVNLKLFPDIFYQYLKIIPASSYATIFKNSMNTDIFSAILSCMKSHYLPAGETEEILTILENITKVGRFSTFLMFLSKQEKTEISSLVEKCSSSDLAASVINKYKL